MWCSSNIEDLKSLSLKILLHKAWIIRKKYFNNEIVVVAPSTKRYKNVFFSNTNYKFTSISCTDKKCEFNCKVCIKKHKVLHVADFAELQHKGKELFDKGCEGLLIYSAVNSYDSSQLEKFVHSVNSLKKLGLKVIIHTDFPSDKLTKIINKIEIDQVILCFSNLKGFPLNNYKFFNELYNFKNTELQIAPHIIIGQDYEKELDFIKLISKDQLENLSLVTNFTTYFSDKHNLDIDCEKYGKLISITRILNPQAKISLGC